MSMGAGAARRPFAEVPDEAKPYAVAMRDGIRLATDVYLPVRGTRWPVLLSRLPYDKAGDECFMPAIAGWFNERGYAVVIQDVRGKMRSDGQLGPFRHETLDGYDTIDWIARQSWCSGPVGMFGDSYFGWTQWAAAAAGHPALAAIAPRVTSADFNDLVTRQGVFCLEVSSLWAFETWVDEGLYDLDGQLDWSVRPLSGVVPTALGGRHPVFLHDAAAGNLDESARSPVRGDIPALHLGGWFDLLKRGQLDTWRHARVSRRAPQFLLMDDTDHGWTHLRSPGQSYVDPHRDAIALHRFLDSYLGPMVPFFDHFLAGRSSYDVAPVRWKLPNGDWRESAEWPPPESRPVDWYLSGDSLVTSADPVAKMLSWVHDPADPVPSLGHAYHPLIEPVDESTNIQRPDLLVFETEALREVLDLAGPADVRARLTSGGPSMHVMARLIDVAPDGTGQRIVDGAVRAPGPWPVDVAIDLGDAGYRVRAGHRLRLELSSSEFPRYVLHPGNDADPWTAVDHQMAEQGIVIGGGEAARLRCFATAGGRR
jgi:hypothetical protein